MTLISQLTALKNQSDLTLAERADVSCRLAKQLEKAGEYEAACEALSEFWPGQDRPPKVNELDELTTAEVVLRIGALTGWKASADQTTDGQETAKNLITNAIEVFESLKESQKVAEGRADLALCYWREGAFDEARVHSSIRTS